jgi:hypothetical protein
MRDKSRIGPCAVSFGIGSSPYQWQCGSHFKPEYKRKYLNGLDNACVFKFQIRGLSQILQGY